MTQKNKIKQFIIEYIDESNETVKKDEIVSIVESLESNKLISFFFVEHERDFNSWVSAETGTIIKGSKYIGITFDYHIELYEQKIDEFVDYILKLDKEAKEIANKLK